MKISVYIATTVDGFIAREDGDVSWLDDFSQNSEEDCGFGVFFDPVDCVVMGRKTFEKVLTFEEWAYVGKQVVVLSRNKVEIPNELVSSVESLSGQPSEIVEILHSRGFQHLYIDGGYTIRSFLAAKHVDRMILTQVPLLLGSGVPLFGELGGEIRLQHVTTGSFPAGLVQTEYRIVYPSPE